MSTKINERVHENTDFVKINAGITKLNEFLDINGAVVKPKIPYHIHYTNAKEEIYMTGALHDSKSKLIIKISPDTNFAKYKNSKNGRLSRDLYINANSLKVTEKDYESGRVSRYFARQSNYENGEIFEINQSDFDLETPYYKKVSLDWLLVGSFDEVKKHNEKEINNAMKVLPRIGNILNSVQFFKPSEQSKSYIYSQLIRDYKVATTTSETDTTSGGGSTSGGY